MFQKEIDAVAWLSAAAKWGNACAKAELGVWHEQGKGTAADGDKALKLYREAAEEGCFCALERLYPHTKGKLTGCPGQCE